MLVITALWSGDSGKKIVTTSPWEKRGGTEMGDVIKVAAAIMSISESGKKGMAPLLSSGPVRNLQWRWGPHRGEVAGFIGVDRRRGGRSCNETIGLNKNSLAVGVSFLRRE